MCGVRVAAILPSFDIGCVWAFSEIAVAGCTDAGCRILCCALVMPTSASVRYVGMSCPLHRKSPCRHSATRLVIPPTYTMVIPAHIPWSFPHIYHGHSRTYPRHSREGGNLDARGLGRGPCPQPATHPRHSRTHPRHSREGGNLDAPSTNHPANAISDLARAGIPMNTSSDAGRGIPAFAGMTMKTRTTAATGMTMKTRMTAAGLAICRQHRARRETGRMSAACSADRVTCGMIGGRSRLGGEVAAPCTRNPP